MNRTVQTVEALMATYLEKVAIEHTAIMTDTGIMSVMKEQY